MCDEPEGGGKSLGGDGPGAGESEGVESGACGPGVVERNRTL